MHPQVVRLAPPHLSEVDVFATDVQAWEVQDVPLAQPAEVATFATDKRRGALEWPVVARSSVEAMGR